MSDERKGFVVAVDGGTVTALPDGEHIGLEFLLGEGGAVRVAIRAMQAQSFMEALLLEGLKGLQQIHARARTRPDGATVN